MPCTALLEDRNRLAAPTKTITAPGFSLLESAQLVSDATEVDRTTPGFLLQARLLTERQPDSATSWARLARSELDCGNREEAAGAAHRVIEMLATEQDLGALMVASQVLADTDQSDVAEKTLGRAADEARRDRLVFPGTILYATYAARRDEPASVLERLSGMPDDDAVAAGLRGWALIRSRRYAEAVGALRTAVATSDPDPDAFVNLGFAYGACGSLRKAIKATKAALHIAAADRTAGFNLVSMQIALGDYEGARRSVLLVRKHHPDDISVEFAAAEIECLIAGPKAALNKLSSLQAGARMFRASRVERAELKTNIALLRYRSGSLGQADALAILARELEACDFESLGIAGQLIGLVGRRSQHSMLVDIYAGLRDKHGAEALLGVQTSLAMLEERYDEATHLAQAWAEAELFSAAPFITATYLLSLFQGDLEGAVKLGRDALRRIPDNVALLNNVAFALAMLGRPQEARRFLPDEQQHPRVAPTAALIDLASGNLEAGRRHYESARKAFEDSEPDYARLIDSWRLAAEWHFGYRDDSGLGITTSSEDDCRYVMLRDAFARPTWRRRGGQGTRRGYIGQ